MTKPTFVSALFNIDRVDGRKWDQYLKWFEETLKLQVPVSYTHLTLPTKA